MTTHFFHLLKTPIDDKGARLAAQISALNETGEAEETYALDPADFSLIPDSPFAYWVQDLTTSDPEHGSKRAEAASCL